MIEWLNFNSGSMTSVLTVALILLTAVYVWLTSKLVKDNEALRRVATQPALEISLSVHEAFINIINLRIANLGSGTARGITFLIDQKDASGVKDLRSLGPFKNGLGSLGPHQSIELFLANAFEGFDDAKTKPIKISAYWKDDFGQEYKREFGLDLVELENIARVGKHPLYSIADALEGTNKLLNAIGTKNRKFQVLSYSLDEHQNEDRSQLLYGRIQTLSDVDKLKVEGLIEELKRTTTRRYRSIISQ